MTNLFPLPLWAPALKRVPIPLQALDEAFAEGSSARRRSLFADCVLGARGALSTLAARRQPARATASASRSR
jgi:hypothetical protein